MHHTAGPSIREHRSQCAGHVDAEMFVEATILGRQHGLDEMVRELLERTESLWRMPRVPISLP